MRYYEIFSRSFSNSVRSVSSKYTLANLIQATLSIFFSLFKTIRPIVLEGISETSFLLTSLSTSSANWLIKSMDTGRLSKDLIVPRTIFSLSNACRPPSLFMTKIVGPSTRSNVVKRFWHFCYSRLQHRSFRVSAKRTLHI